MKPALGIAELIKIPTFGINKVRKIAVENITQAVVLEYAFIRGGKVLRVKVLRPHPGDELKPLSQFVELPVTTEEDNVTFINKVKGGEYLEHAGLKQEEFKDDFLPLYIAQLEAKLAYGTDPIVSHVIHNSQGIATIYFSTVKEGERVPHTARWSRLNIAESLNAVIVVPRPVYKSYRDFMTIVAGLLETDVTRLFLKEDPVDAVNGVELYVDVNDLVYFGSIKVSITPGGDKAAIYTKDAVIPEEPTDPEEGGSEGTVETQTGEPLLDGEGNPIQTEG